MTTDTFHLKSDPCAEFRWDNGVCMHSAHDHDTCTCNEFFTEPGCTIHALPIKVDHEPTRLAIEARVAAGSAWTTTDTSACRVTSGELLRSAHLSDTQGVIVFERKYGERPGYRTVVLTAPDAKSPLRLVTNAFADMPKSTEPNDRVKTYHTKDVLEVTKPAPKVTRDNLTAMLPSDATSPAMSYTFHVRSMGDHHVICSTTSLADAKRIVAALGNCGVFQFRDSRSYDTTTIWRVA
jgi:hypothetical protein